MTAFLKQADVQRLMAQPSPHVRAVIANKLALEIDRPELTEPELALAHDIIRAMAKDVEVIVRRSVAHNLRHSKQLPRDVAIQLAEDIEAVSLPILTDSIVLTDEDLIQILGHSTAIKQQAIASRPEVSELVAEAIIESTNDSVVATLMANKTAHISETGFSKAIERFAKNDTVKESMVMREQLPPVIAERLVNIVSDKLQEHLATHHALPAEMAETILAQNRERAILYLNETTSPAELEKFVHYMQEQGRLTPTLIMRALCAGNLPFFEFAMATLADVPVENARLLIHDPGDEAFEALCRKANIPLDITRIMNIAIEVLAELRMQGRDTDIPYFRARVIERVLTRTEDMDPLDQDYLLDLIK